MIENSKLKEKKRKALITCAQVKIASLHKIPFLATGGRHGYTTTLGELDGGLAIDLSQLKAYSIDKATGQLTIGGATTLADFQNDLFAAGYMIRTSNIEQANRFCQLTRK